MRLQRVDGDIQVRGVRAGACCDRYAAFPQAMQDLGNVTIELDLPVVSEKSKGGRSVC